VQHQDLLLPRLLWRLLLLPLHHVVVLDFSQVFRNLKFIRMVHYAMVCLPLQVNLLLFLMLLLTRSGVKQWRRNMMLYFKTKLGTWFLPVPIKMLLTANGYIVSKSEQMVLSIGIKLV
jgi:hypothetical protein